MNRKHWFYGIASIVMFALIVASCGPTSSADGSAGGSSGSADGESGSGESGALIIPGDFGYVRAKDGTGLEISYYTGTSNEIVIPDTIEDIPVVGLWTDVFRGNTGLSSITIPDTVTIIPGAAFKGCTGLGSVKLPAQLKIIGDEAFSGCTSLSAIELPASLTSLNYSSFHGCTDLKTIVIPAGVTTIGSSAFSGCTSLISAQLPEGLTTMGAYAFNGCRNLANLNVPASLTNFPNASYERYNFAFNWCHKVPVESRNKLIAQGYTFGSQTYWEY